MNTVGLSAGGSERRLVMDPRVREDDDLENCAAPIIRVNAGIQ